MISILYLAQDLSDPAVRRRILMLEAGGASVTPAGFRRGDIAAAGTAPAIELGRTQDAKLARRVLSVAHASLSLSGKLAGVPRPDVIIARNLEMLVLAKRAKAHFETDIPIVYECLDLHRLLLRKGSLGGLVRLAEGYFGREARLLITSSPAFVDNYFRKQSHIDCPIHILENKVLSLHEASVPGSPAPQPPGSGEPWKIGWFGALRCRKSLHLLAEFTRRMEGRFELVLRGRPAYSEFEDFDGFVNNEPYMAFHGSYRYPDDIARIYQEVHYTWAIDFFEEGLNSSWLLPNRLYEGCHQNRPPIALKGTQTAHFLSERGLGVILDTPTTDDLVRTMANLDARRFADAAQKLSNSSPSLFVCDQADCAALVARLARLTPLAGNSRPRASSSEPRYNEGGAI